MTKFIASGALLCGCVVYRDLISMAQYTLHIHSISLFETSLIPRIYHDVIFLVRVGLRFKKLFKVRFLRVRFIVLI